MFYIYLMQCVVCVSKICSRSVHPLNILLLFQESDIMYQYDSELREKLRLQSDAHTSHLTDALRFQANELGSKWSMELEFKLMEQEGQYQAELTKAMSRLRGIESMVNTVANAGTCMYMYTCSITDVHVHMYSQLLTFSCVLYVYIHIFQVKLLVINRAYGMHATLSVEL